MQRERWSDSQELVGKLVHGAQPTVAQREKSNPK